MSTKSSSVLGLGSVVFGPAHAPAFGSGTKEIGLGPNGRCIVLATSTDKEICICAGNKMDDGVIIRGHRHDSCILTAGRMGYTRDQQRNDQQGFVTSRNRWVSREEGARLQNEAGIRSVHTRQPINEMLFSEDLY